MSPSGGVDKRVVFRLVGGERLPLGIPLESPEMVEGHSSRSAGAETKLVYFVALPALSEY